MTTQNPLATPETPRPPKLHMLWPDRLLSVAPPVKVASGYALRVFRPSDTPTYLRLMHLAGFTYWTAEILDKYLQKALPDGFFIAEELATGALAATAMATHNPDLFHPFGGELGWVAGDPAHAGKGLGKAVTAAVTCRFLAAGYRRIYLKTDDWRLPAIRIYLDMGWEPFLYEPGMSERWRTICEKVDYPFRPEAWPKLHAAQSV
ncbi:MAG: GNAT family N-acetyltransferase [Candidatus Riflebacteria bacterium]|nr:GNAT family N-acetyltransferase [Candidatus Riflebacteria bacterium]